MSTKANFTQSKTFKLVFSAVMIALGTVLSLLAISLPFGGSVTLGSMVPLVILAQLYGTPWGLLCGFVYGLIQMILGASNLAYGVTFFAVLVIILFDYVVAFGLMGLSGTTRGIRNRGVGAATGALVGCAARYLCHIVSGALVWGEWADVSYVPQILHQTSLVSNPDIFIWTYSVCYNASYMIPETILTVVICALLMRFVNFEKLGLSRAD